MMVTLILKVRFKKKKDIISALNYTFFVAVVFFIVALPQKKNLFQYMEFSVV